MDVDAYINTEDGRQKNKTVRHEKNMKVFLEGARNFILYLFGLSNRYGSRGRDSTSISAGSLANS